VPTPFYLTNATTSHTSASALRLHFARPSSRPLPPLLLTATPRLTPVAWASSFTAASTRAMMPKLVLKYLDMPGLAEPIRLTLHVGGRGLHSFTSQLNT